MDTSRTCRQHKLFVSPQVVSAIGFVPNLYPSVLLMIPSLQDAREVDKVDIGRAWQGPLSFAWRHKENTHNDCTKDGKHGKVSPARKCKLHQKKFLAPQSSLTKSLASSRLQAMGKNNFVQSISTFVVLAFANRALQQLCQLFEPFIRAR